MRGEIGRAAGCVRTAHARRGIGWQDCSCILMFRVNLLVPEEISGRDDRDLTVSGASESHLGLCNSDYEDRSVRAPGRSDLAFMYRGGKV